jgi:hypothetical protein
LSKSRNGKVKIGYSSDLSAMGLTLFNMYLVCLYKRDVKFYDNRSHAYIDVKQYFPFTNDKLTIQSKIDNWSNSEKYNNQVILLNYFLTNSLQIILLNPGLSPEKKDILERDVGMIKTLLLSNDPFEDKIDSTYEEIRTYLIQNGLTPPP